MDFESTASTKLKSVKGKEKTPDHQDRRLANREKDRRKSSYMLFVSEGETLCWRVFNSRLSTASARPQVDGGGTRVTGGGV